LLESRTVSANEYAHRIPIGEVDRNAPDGWANGYPRTTSSQRAPSPSSRTERKSRVPDVASHPADQSVLDQSYNLLEYLSAVAREIGPKPVRDVRQNERTIWSADVPGHRAVTVGPGEDRPTWLCVQKMPAPDAVTVPPEIGGLLEPKEALQDGSAT